MIVVGITGGIGSGKTTVSDRMRELGYPVLDVDAISRSVTAAGGVAIPDIREAFGEEMILSDGSLNRQKMADLVFSNATERKKLEKIVIGEATEQVVESIDAYRKEGKCAILFLDAPTLFENGGERLTDQVWLVTAEQDLRISRVMARDGATREQVLARMASQMPEEEKIRRADHVLYNNGGREELVQNVDELVKHVSETAGREENK